MRTFFVWLLEQEKIEDFFRGEAEHHRAQLADFEARAEGEWPAEPVAQASRVALEWGIRYERAKLEWAEWALGEAASIASAAAAGAARPRAGAAPRA